MPGFSEYLARGQIEVFPSTDWYLKGGQFDLKRTLAMWMEEHDEALARGLAGMRVTGNPYWIDNKKDWDDFACYEAAINDVIGCVWGPQHTGLPAQSSGVARLLLRGDRSQAHEVGLL